MFVVFFLLIAFKMAPCSSQSSSPLQSVSPARSSSIASTLSASLSASATATPVVQSACPSCPRYSFMYTATPQYIYLNTTPYNTSTHIELHMWGGQGGGNYGPGGTGAFVTGILPLSGLGNVLRVLVGSCGAPDAGQTQGAGFQYAGGGRSAIQVPDTSNLTGSGWLDVVTAGGGGGAPVAPTLRQLLQEIGQLHQVGKALAFLHHFLVRKGRGSREEQYLQQPLAFPAAVAGGAAANHPPVAMVQLEEALPAPISFSVFGGRMPRLLRPHLPRVDTTLLASIRGAGTGAVYQATMALWLLCP